MRSPTTTSRSSSIRSGAIAYLNRGILMTSSTRSTRRSPTTRGRSSAIRSRWSPISIAACFITPSAIMPRAVADFTKASQLGPNDGLSFYCLGNAYDALGDLQKAVADYGETLKRKPRTRASASARRRLSRLEQARPRDRRLNQAIKLDANAAEAYLGRGAIYRMKGDFDRAIADGSEAIKRNPKLPPPISIAARPTHPRAISTIRRRPFPGDPARSEILELLFRPRLSTITSPALCRRPWPI